MTIKTISYSESKETVDTRGLKQWRKIGVEVDVNEGEEWSQVFLDVKALVKAWHQTETSVSSQSSDHEIFDVPPPEINLAHERMLISIEESKTIPDLNNVIGSAKGNGLSADPASWPRVLLTAYLNKGQQLKTLRNE